MTDPRSPQPPLRAMLASRYLSVLQRWVRTDRQSVQAVHAYVDHLRSELRAARQALAERDDPSLAEGAPPAEPETWAARAAILVEQEQQQRARTWLPRPDARPRDERAGR